MIRRIVCFWITILLTAHLSTAGAQSLPVITRVDLPSLLDSIAKQEQPTIINFWSTWCKPCIDEIPHFLEVAEKFQSSGVRLVLVSLDTRSLYENGGLQRWVQKKKWQTNMLWLSETNADVYCPAIDAKWSGVIPATLIINPQRGYRFFIEESLSEAELTKQVAAALVGAGPMDQKNTPQP